MKIALENSYYPFKPRDVKIVYLVLTLKRLAEIVKRSDSCFRDEKRELCKPVESLSNLFIPTADQSFLCSIFRGD